VNLGICFVSAALQIFFEYAAAALSRIFKNLLKNPPKASFQTGPRPNYEK